MADCWRDSGVGVSAITRSPQKADELRAAGLNAIVFDLARSHDLNVSLPNVDTVLWAVGFERGGDVSREDIWLNGLQRLIESFAEPPRQIIYVSSTSVYGQADGNTVDESTPPNPLTEGGRCCLQAENLLRTLCADRHPSTAVTVLRMAGIYGPDRLLRRIADLKARAPLAVQPDHPLNLIHVDDAVRMIDCIRQADPVLPLLNVVNTGTLTRREYYTLLAELVDAPPPLFAAEPAEQSRGGNKIVSSQHHDRFRSAFLFDDVRSGLHDAVDNSR